jgi:tRNA(Ile)-lysidine synthetase-like protein
MRAAAAAIAGAAAAAIYLALRRRRKTDDARINTVLDFWFKGADRGRKLWFARGSDRDAADALVRDRFADVVEEALSGKLEHWRRTPRGSIALVVVLDQLARHVHRDEDHTLSAKRAAEVFRDDFLSRWDPHTFLTPSQHAFGLLSMRHANRYNYEVIEKLIERRQNHDKREAEVLDKFRRATQRRRRERAEPPGGRPNLNGEDAELLDARCTQGGTEKETEVHGVLKDFVKTHGRCAVSLSGGVDSMVLLYVLSKLTEVSALHINYGNRPEADAEQLFLERWCSTLSIPLKVLRMPSHLRRGVTDREQYEKEARELRFAFYREESVPILLAHHRGDVMENCVSNSLKGAGPLRLAGMNETDRLYDVEIRRPLLTLDKAQILKVAFDHGVPFFRDSTPAWSTRGRLRNEVLPLLKDVYGAGCLESITQLAEDSDQLRALCDRRVFHEAHSSIARGRLGVRIALLPFKEESPFFWRTFLGDLADSLGRGRLSRKAINLLVQRLKGARGVASIPVEGALPVEGWLELKKGWRSYLDEQGNLYLFDDAVFEGKVPHGAAVPLDATTQFGRWTVAATRVEAFVDGECDLAAFVATGRFEYHVQCSTLTLAPRQGLRKCRPLQRLDGLTKSPRLRDVVPVPVGAKGDRWVRVTVSFNVMYLYSQTSRRSPGSSAATRASRCRRAPRRPGRRRGH